MYRSILFTATYLLGIANASSNESNPITITPQDEIRRKILEVVTELETSDKKDKYDIAYSILLYTGQETRPSNDLMFKHLKDRISILQIDMESKVDDFRNCLIKKSIINKDTNEIEIIQTKVFGINKSSESLNESVLNNIIYPELDEVMSILYPKMTELTIFGMFSGTGVTYISNLKNLTKLGKTVTTLIIKNTNIVDTNMIDSNFTVMMNYIKSNFIVLNKLSYITLLLINPR